MKKVALIVLDGWGIAPPTKHNAVHIAHTPFMDHAWRNYPHTTLQASGEFVGLPSGQIGGSEVGHLTLGAGRVVYQDLPRINHALEDDALSLDTLTRLIEKGKKHVIHLIGLLSAGGIHSHQQHLFRLLQLLEKNGCKPPTLHLITDGRDSPPRAVRRNLDELEKHTRHGSYGQVATMSGRFFAMDRDKNWGRTDEAVQAILGNSAKQFSTSSHKRISNRIDDAIEDSYVQDISDEFIKPVIVDPSYKGIEKEDVLFFFNFRSDRMKQLVSSLSNALPRHELFTMTQYDQDYAFPVVFEKQHVNDTLGQVVSAAGKTQLRAAETEKYAHVTYFFNGGVEVVFPLEKRHLIKSDVVRPDKAPNMKAQEIRQSVCEEVNEHHPDFILVNFANSDMVGHTGNFKAVVAGIEKVDKELKKLCEHLIENNYTCCITADHGNADIMFDQDDNSVYTAHTISPVPFIIYGEDLAVRSLELSQRLGNGLQHVAPTIIELMGMSPQPQFVTSLIKHS